MSFSPVLNQENRNMLIAAMVAAILCGCVSVDGSPKAATAPNDTTFDQANALDSEKRLVHLPKDAEREAGLSVEEAQKRKLDICVDVTAEVLANANTTTHVTTPVTGRITEILGRIGDHVSEGKPLLIVRSTDIEQVESDMLQNMQQVRSDLKQALVQIDCDT